MPLQIIHLRRQRLVIRTGSPQAAPLLVHEGQQGVDGPPPRAPPSGRQGREHGGTTRVVFAVALQALGEADAAAMSLSLTAQLSKLSLSSSKQARR